MKYHLHENGWTVLVDDFDFNCATQRDINEIAKLIASNTCVVFKNQFLFNKKYIEQELGAEPEP